MKTVVVIIVSAFISIQLAAQTRINAEDAKRHIGEVVTVCGKVYTAKYLQNAVNQPTLLNLGAPYPKQLLTIAIFEMDRKNFPFKPEDYYPNTEICVTGKLIDYKGQPEIVVQSPEQMKLQFSNTSTTKTELPVKPIEKQKPAPVTDASIEGIYDITLSEDVNLREGPGLSFGIAAVLYGGSVVTVLKSNNGWSYVEIKRLIGPATSATKGYIKNNVLK